METTHGRAKKCKTEFKAVLNKVLVSGLVLATMLGTATPAFAAEMPKDNLTSYATNVAYSQGISVESAISDIRNTISTIKGMIEDGKVSDSILQTLCTQLYSLESAIKANGATSDVYNVLDEAENVVYNMGKTATTSASSKAYAALAEVRSSLDNVSVSNKADVNVSTPVSAPLKGFSDVDKSNWAYDAIIDMALNRGMINGTTTPDANGMAKFSPDGQMTRAQFIVIITRYLYPDALKQMDSQGQGSSWWSNGLSVATGNGLIGAGDFAQTDESMGKPMTRQEMALVLARASSVKGTTTNNLVSLSSIPDFNSIDAAYKTNVLQVYSQGLIAGTDDKGTFNPDGVLNRAQAATVIYRLIQRAETGTATTTPVNPADNDGERTPASQVRTLRWNDSSRPYAREGDIFIAPDGKEYKLTRDAKTGIVGYGQPIATDLGRTENGQTVTDGGIVFDLSRPANSGNQYLINDHTGEGHWSSEWADISDEYYPDYRGTKDGELSKDKNFVWSSIMGGWRLVIDDKI